MKKHKLRSVCQAALISVLLCIPINGVAEDEGLYKGPYHDESTDDRNHRNGPCLDADKFNKAWKTALKRIGELVSQRFDVGSRNKRSTMLNPASIFRDHFAKMSGED